jgi:hypothetical protein
MRHFFSVSLCLLALTLSGSTQMKKAVTKKVPVGPAPDKALMQKIWEGWSTLDPANVRTRPAHLFRHRARQVQQLG